MAYESAMQLHCRAGCPCSGDRPKLSSSSQGPKATQVCNRKAQCPKGLQQHRSTLEAQTCTTKRQLQGRGLEENTSAEISRRSAQSLQRTPKNLHSATSAQINQPMSWKQVTKSPGAKTCNGRAAVSRAARNNAPAAKPCPTMQQPCNNKTTQRIQRPKRPTQTSQRSKTRSSNTPRRGPSARRNKEPKARENTCQCKPNSAGCATNPAEHHGSSSQAADTNHPKGGRHPSQSQPINNQEAEDPPMQQYAQLQEETCSGSGTARAAEEQQKRSQSNKANAPCGPKPRPQQGPSQKWRSNNLRVEKRR
jgi:hypothetical protein